MFKYNFINTVKKIILINIQRAIFSFNQNEPLLLKFCYLIYLIFGYNKITLFFLKHSLKKISCVTDINHFIKIASLHSNNNFKNFHDLAFDYKKKIFFNSEQKIPSLSNKKSNQMEFEQGKFETYIDDLKQKGYCEVTDLLNLDSSQINNFVNKVFKIKAYNSQVPLQSNCQKVEINNSYNYFSFDPGEPELRSYYKIILQNKSLSDIINSYLKFEAQLYSISTMVSLQNQHKHSVTNIHRDYDDIHFLALFVYWTDVNANNGATSIIPGSHLNNNRDLKSLKFLSGKPGSAFLVDTFAEHSGNKELLTPRVTTWFRFGRPLNHASYVDKNYLFLNYYKSLYF
jgi:hypothetical protein